MNELEQRLVDLGAALDVPRAPDLVTAVRGRFEPRGQLRRRVPRRTLAVAILFAVLFAGTALAVAPVRHAIERVLGLQGASVQRVRHLPPLPTGAPRSLRLGQRIPIADARHAASFRALLPTKPPQAAYISHDVAGGRITLIAGKLVIMEFRGQSTPYILKLIGPGTRAVRARVNGGAGVYLDGAAHQVFFIDINGNGQTDTVRLAGNVLLWQQGTLILRIEGATTLASALKLADSLR